MKAAKASVAKKKYNYGTGRRKSSAARVFIKPGNGEITINSKPLKEYFTRPTSVMIVHQPLEVTNQMAKFDIMVTVRGGGNASQAGAVRLGIARALVEYDRGLNPALYEEAASDSTDEATPIDTFKRRLRAHGYLTRDAREVERKKVGLRKARKRPQYSKR